MSFEISPQAWRRIHFWLALVWFVVGIGLVFAPKTVQSSVPLLLAISVYANFVGHVSSWQASRTEVRQERDNG